jgi:hypothetical protein
MKKLTEKELTEPELLKEISESLKRIEQKLTGSSKDEFDFIDNAELLALMKISARTAMDWRDKGTLKYSKVHGKIYYRLSDLKQMVMERFNRKMGE